MVTKIGFNVENTYKELPDIFYEELSVKPVPNPELVIYNEKLGKELGFNIDETNQEEAVMIFAGNRSLEGVTPIAQSYAGHQFGHFTMLGDGRAMLLGEQLTPTNERVDIQLKGAGRTAYSRGGDGRAALGPMIREYIISEAMHELSIPTTRSLAVVKTGESVQREIAFEGGILTRVASSHIRVGTFQFAAKYGEMDDLVALADYTINRHDPEVKGASNPYLAFLKQVIKRQATLLAKWQLVGFIHGVMNTDNMTISGETIDYGPCAFMDRYHQEAVFSSIDYHGRYKYRNQPSIAAWNLARFSEALLPLLGNSKEEAINHAQDAISDFGKIYENEWMRGMRGKLGLFNEEREDEQLIEELLTLMQHYQADYTNTFLALTYETAETLPMYPMKEFQNWKTKWEERLTREGKSKEEALERMHESNPALIPRNKWVEEAIEAAVQANDYTVTEELVDVLKDPYAHTNKQKEFANKKFDTDEGYQTFCGT